MKVLNCWPLVLCTCLVIAAVPRDACADEGPVAGVVDDRAIRVGASYFGVWIVRPGLRLDVDLPLFIRNDTSLGVSTHVGIFHHAGRATALMADAGGFIRRRFGPSWFLELRAGLGGLQSWLAGETFTVGSDGAVSPVPFAARATFTQLLSFGGGRELGRPLGLPVEAFARLVVFGSFPVNENLVFHGGAQVGLAWRLESVQ